MPWCVSRTWVFHQSQDVHVEHWFELFLKIYQKIKEFYMLNNMTPRIRPSLELAIYAAHAQSASTGCWHWDYSEWFFKERAFLSNLISLVISLSPKYSSFFAIELIQFTQKNPLPGLKQPWMVCWNLTFSSQKPMHPPCSVSFDIFSRVYYSGREWIFSLTFSKYKYLAIFWGGKLSCISPYLKLGKQNYAC